MRRRIAAAAVAVVGAAALTLIGINTRSLPAARPVDARTANVATTVEPTEQPQRGASAIARQQPSRAAPPASFRNTDVDGSVRVDANGRITPTRALRDLFDYYLSGVGEYAQKDPATAVKTRLIGYARAQGLSDPERAQLLTLFDRYMAYRRAAAAYIGERRPQKTADTLRNLSEMRIAYLGTAMAEAFYGHDEQRIRAAIARRQGEAGAESLTARQRAALAPIDLARHVASLRKNSADEATVAMTRGQIVHRAAVQRLEALDAQRTQWNTTVAAYRRERVELMNSSMAAIDRRTALTALRKRYFSKRDRRRIEALDRLAAKRGHLSSE